MVFSILSFAGFEGAATLGEETINPRRNIPIALLGTVLVHGHLLRVRRLLRGDRISDRTVSRTSRTPRRRSTISRCTMPRLDSPFCSIWSRPRAASRARSGGSPRPPRMVIRPGPWRIVAAPRGGTSGAPDALLRSDAHGDTDHSVVPGLRAVRRRGRFLQRCEHHRCPRPDSRLHRRGRRGEGGGLARPPAGLVGRVHVGADTCCSGFCTEISIRCRNFRTICGRTSHFTWVIASVAVMRLRRKLVRTPLSDYS